MKVESDTIMKDWSMTNGFLIENLDLWQFNRTWFFFGYIEK